MYFPNEDPVGHRIKLVPDVATGTEPTWMSIVGVSPTVRQRNFQDPDPDPVVYVPYRAMPTPFMTLIVRAPGDPSTMTPALREEVRALDPDLPLFGIRTMDEMLAQARWPFRVFGSMFAIFATIALLLSAIGLYAITAYSVTQRTQEIGVRMALGAQQPQVWWLVIRRSFAQLVLGLLLGMAGAFGVGRLLRSLLVQTSPNDPLTLVSIAVLFTLVSIAACFWPARRATRLDPVRALRYECRLFRRYDSQTSSEARTRTASTDVRRDRTDSLEGVRCRPDTSSTLDPSSWYMGQSSMLVLAVAVAVYSFTLVMTGLTYPAGSTWSASTRTTR